jgi:hypothetical protein
MRSWSGGSSSCTLSRHVLTSDHLLLCMLAGMIGAGCVCCHVGLQARVAFQDKAVLALQTGSPCWCLLRWT